MAYLESEPSLPWPMQGGRTSAKWCGIVLFLMILMPAMGTVHAASGDATETVKDGRIIGVLTSPDQTYERTWQIQENQWTSLSVECGQCSVELEVDGIVNEVTATVILQATMNGTARMTVVSPVEEFVRYSLIEVIDEQHPTVRPGPGETTNEDEPWICEGNERCSDLSTGLESTPSTEFIPGEYLLGVLEHNQAEYIAIPIEEKDTLELQLLHSTSDLMVEVYMQSTTEVLLNGTLSEPLRTQTNQGSETIYWHASSSGRFILKISSDSPSTAYAIKRVIHEASIEPAMMDLNQQSILSGHNSMTAIMEVNDTTVVQLDALHVAITGEVEQLVDGFWLSAIPLASPVGQRQSVYPYPNASALRFTLIGDVFAMELATTTFSDLESTHEAPSLRPSSPTLNNTSWPVLPKSTEALPGQLTLAIHDTADVFKIEIIGYEESIHLVQVSVLSTSLEHLQLEMWEMDQTEWEPIDVREVLRVNGRLQTALELQPGTHFVRVSHTDVANATNHTWGAQVDPITYMVATASTMIDEGIEPYFPPDESTVEWGGVARWFMGLLFLLPCIYFVFILRANNKLAQEWATKTEQLAWFKSQMDTGATEAKTLRKSLDKSLQAIAQLDWETACTTWGLPDGEHRTHGVAMAAWVLDRRMSKTEGAQPVMVGIHVLEGQWELSALRFDAPEGGAWEVVNVEPRFLSRGEEIFVDTMREGNITFLTLELKGKAESFDIELNGVCAGVAMAARMPQTLRSTRTEEE